MHCSTVTIVTVVACCLLASRAAAEETVEQSRRSLAPAGAAVESQADGSEIHTREKRTLFLKKKLLGAGLLGFGLGIAKGYKAGYFGAPQVHHVYLPPPPLKYVQYVEKPVYIEKIVPKPVYGPPPPPHNDYGPPHWSQPSPSYGDW